MISKIALLLGLSWLGRSLAQAPSLSVETKIVAGTSVDDVCSTAPVDSFSGDFGDNVTICLETVNTGDTPLIGVSIVDPSINIDQSIDIIFPGVTVIVRATRTLRKDLVTNVTVTGTPATDASTPIEGAAAVTASDSVTVSVFIPPTSSPTVGPTSLSTDIQLEMIIVPGDNVTDVCSRAPVDSFLGALGDRVTICIEAVNAGSSTLLDITVDEPALNISESFPRLYPNGGLLTIITSRTLVEDFTSDVTMTGTLGFQTLTPLPDEPRVSFSDSVTVTVLPTSSPSLGPTALAPRIDVETKIVAGENTAGVCQADPVEEFTGNVGDRITICINTTNPGDTRLIDVSVVDPVLNIDRLYPELLPGGSIALTATRTLTADFTNEVTVMGIPAFQESGALPNEPVATDTDSVTVTAVSTTPSGGSSSTDSGASIYVETKIISGGSASDACGSATISNFEGDFGEKITICIVTINNGITPLTNVVIDDPVLGIMEEIASLAAGSTLFLTTTRELEEAFTNEVTVTASPATEGGTPVAGASPVSASGGVSVTLLTGPPPTSSPTSRPTSVAPMIDVEAIVVDGPDVADACSSDASDEYTGNSGDEVTICIRTENTGDTKLIDIVITETNLGIDQFFAELTPRSTIFLRTTRRLRNDFAIDVTASATATFDDSSAIPGQPAATDSDVVTVTVMP